LKRGLFTDQPLLCNQRREHVSM